MKITFEEVLSSKTWIASELLSSLSYEIIDTAINDQFYDVKLLVNGIQLEPKLFNDIMNNVEKYIDSEARKIVLEKLEKAEYKTRRLDELISDACEKIKLEFDLENK